MKKQLIITEIEKKNILNLYKHFLNEKIEGTTYVTENPQKLYAHRGVKFFDDYINLKEGTKFEKQGDDGAIAWGGKLAFSCEGMIVHNKGKDKYNFLYNTDGLENDGWYYNDVLTKKLKSIFCTPGGIVDGCTKGDCKNGYGAITYPSGNKYVGNFKDGERNGYGTFTWNDGDKYVGNFKDGLSNGYGTYTFSYGDKYVGNFKDDSFNGYGTYTFSNGLKYVGNFKDGERNGYGTFTYSSGNKYVGNFKDDSFNGYGTYTNTHGIEFSGNWVDNELNGKSLDDLNKLTKPIEKEDVPKNTDCPKPDKPMYSYTGDKKYEYAKSGDCWWAQNKDTKKWFNLTNLVIYRPGIQATLDRLEDGGKLVDL
jgi:hypothetical protein